MATSESGQGFVPPGDALPEYEVSAEDIVEGTEIDHATAEPPTEAPVEPRTCCEERERRLRASFEEKIAKLEKTREEQKNEYAEIMQECIIVRDEQLAVAKFKLEERNEAIDQLRKIVKSGEAKLEELAKLVRSLGEQLSRPRDIESKPPPMKAKCDKPASEKISKTQKCKYTTMNIGNFRENYYCPSLKMKNEKFALFCLRDL